MTEDVDARWAQARRFEVSAEVAVEGAAGDTAPTVGTGWPQGLFWLHRGEILAEGCQGLLNDPERGPWQFPFAVFPTFAPVAVVDRFSILN